MKKIVSYVGMLLGAALILSSCGENLGGTITPTDEHQIVILASEGVNTRTYIDGASVKWASGVEQLRVFEVATPTAGDPVSSKVVSSVGVSEDGGLTMGFGVTLGAKDAAENDFDYYAFYPSSAYQTGNDATSIAINTDAVQTPAATSFDPTADLLIAEGITGEDSQPANLEMRFTRMVSVGKMTIKNLESTDPIKRITFSAKVGDTPVVLAGRTTYDLTTATVKSSYGNNVSESSIILDYSALNLTANTAEGMTAFFTCYPFALNSVTPGSFKVIVETATEAFTKEVTVNSAKGLAFNVGKASTFSVDMGGITGEVIAADLCYAYLELADVDHIITDNSYVNATVTKTHGDKWSMFASNVSSCIGVRRNDQENNDSYIKLPVFVDDIKTVVVTLNSPVADKTITLESSATDNTGSIAELTTTASTVYTFDLTSVPSIKTAYFRAGGFRAQVKKIEVFAGADTRVALSTPNAVAAVRNTDDGDITNKIDVSWDSVIGAIGYEVTLTPSEGDAVVQSTASTSYSFDNLEYSTTYTPSVIAIADPYLNFNSLAGTGAAVSTAAAPAILSLTSSKLSGIEANSYGTLQSITDGDYTWKHTGNRAALSGYIQLNTPESRYIEIPLAPGTINKIVLSVTNASATSEGDTGNKCKQNLTFSCLDYSVSSDIDTENGVNEITLTPTTTTYRNGVITASGAVRIWGIRVFYSADEATLSSIAITTDATKTVYSLNEAIVFDGKVKGTFSNGSLSDVTSLISITGSTASAGSTDVTVSFGGQSTSYSITVSAGPSLQYTLTPKAGSDNGYATAEDITIDEINWNVTGNCTLIPWRIGGKNLSGVDRALYSKTPISANVSRIVITHSGASSVTVNSMKVYVCSTAAGAAKSTPTDVVASFTPSFVASGDVTINKADDTSWANCYYRIVYNVTIGSSNKFIAFSEAKFYGTN